MAEPMNILLTSVGRRVSLLESFRAALGDLGLKGRVLGADRTSLAPGFQAADEGFLVPTAAGPDYVQALLDICRRQHVALVIPLIDWELATIAAARVVCGGRHAGGRLGPAGRGDLPRQAPHL